jgi:hypothetical protein
LLEHVNFCAAYIAQVESKRSSHGGTGAAESEVLRTSTLCGFSLNIRLLAEAAAAA